MKKLALLALGLSLTLASCNNTTAPTTEKTSAELAATPFLDTYLTTRKVGATTEFSKYEGVAFDKKSNTLYMAISKIEKDMVDGKGDIRMPANRCGGIFAVKLDGGFDSSKIVPVLVGKEEGNGCAADSIAEPDNIFMDGKGRLWIGEDTGKHANNILWTFDPASKELKRFATLPLLSEAAGLHINEAGEVFLNVQHPSTESIAPFNSGTVGVFSGFNANTDDFVSLGLPQGDDQKTLKVAKGSYNLLSRAGDDGAGIILDGKGQPTTIRNGDINKDFGYCNNPDGNMFLKGADANSATLYSNFECVPGGVLKQTLQKVGGDWKVTSRQMVDFKGVQGTWRNCNGSVTPWNTALTSEEDSVEVVNFHDWADDVYKKNAGSASLMMSNHLFGEGSGRVTNFYDYGYIVELKPTAAGTEVKKHYAMGRSNWELAVVMPDQRTAYLGDDGNFRAFYKFVADQAGDLSAGTLYAAKATQVDDGSSANGKSLNITWVKVGHGVDSEIEKVIRSLDNK